MGFDELILLKFGQVRWDSWCVVQGGCETLMDGLAFVECQRKVRTHGGVGMLFLLATIHCSVSGDYCSKITFDVPGAQQVVLGWVPRYAPFICSIPPHECVVCELPPCPWFGVQGSTGVSYPCVLC